MCRFPSCKVKPVGFCFRRKNRLYDPLWKTFQFLKMRRDKGRLYNSKSACSESPSSLDCAGLVMSLFLVKSQGSAKSFVALEFLVIYYQIILEGVLYLSLLEISNLLCSTQHYVEPFITAGLCHSIMLLCRAHGQKSQSLVSKVG